MNISAAFSLMPPWLQGTALIFLAVSYLLGHVISNTTTPPPNTPWGIVYGWIEFLAGIYGKAKQVGIPVPTAADMQSALALLLREAQTSGKLLDPGAVAGAMGIALPPQAPAAVAAPPPVPVPVPAPPAVPAATTPPPPPLGGVASTGATVLLAFGLILAMSACSSPDQASTGANIQSAVATANADAATAGHYLPDACAALAIAHSGFQVAEDLDPAVAANKTTELDIYTNLTTGAGICSPASQATPPTNAAELIAAAYSQVRVFIPTLPGAPTPPASAPGGGQ